MLKNKCIFSDELIDGTGGPIKKKVVITLKRDKIKSLEQNSSFSEFIQRANQDACIDYKDSIIIPCLIDSHVHLSMKSEYGRKKSKLPDKSDYSKIQKIISKNIHSNILYGIIAARDAGDKHGHLLTYRDKVLDKRDELFKIKAAGWAFYKKGRYGKLLGRAVNENSIPTKPFLMSTKKIDHIKIINSGLNSLNHYGKETNPQFTITELRKTVQEAGNLGLKIMVHANGKIPVQIAVDAGCDSIEHGYFMGRKNLKKMADNQIFWVPTVAPMKAIAGDPNTTPLQKKVALKNYNHQLKQLNLGAAYGIPIALGTDAGSPGVHHGRALIEEMSIMKEAGFSIEKIIKWASFNNAKLLGLDHMGHLGAGQPASFIVVKGDNSELPKSLIKIEAIYVNGVRLDGKRTV